MARQNLSGQLQRFLPLTDERYMPQLEARLRDPVEDKPRYVLFSLPPELRLEIYGHLFKFPPRSTLHEILRKSEWVVPALGVCVEMRNAGLRMIYARNEIHLDIVSYQFASFETITRCADSPEGLHQPILALDRNTMSLNPPAYQSEQFYERPCMPLPGSLFPAAMIRNVSVSICLALYRDDGVSLSMKIIFKMLSRLTHTLMPNLDRICLSVRKDGYRRVINCPNLTSSLMASCQKDDEDFVGGSTEVLKQKWLASIPYQIRGLPVKARELQLEGVSDEVFEVIASHAKVSR